MRTVLVIALILLTAGLAHAQYCTMSWNNSAEPIPTPRLRGGGGVYDGQLIVYAGFNISTGSYLDDTQIYDPDTDSWTAGDTVPVGTLDNGYAVAPEGYAYLIAGSTELINYTNTVYEYDIEGDSWSTLSFTYPLTGWAPACAAPGDGFVYCFGGSTDGSTPSTYAAKYEIGSDAAWTAIAPLPAGKFFADAVAFNGIIYISGGWAVETTTYAYDIAANSYTTVDALNNGRQRPSLVVAGDLIWVTGGGNAWTPIGADEYFDFTAWTATGSTMTVPVLGAVAGYVPGRGILVAGGRNAASADTAHLQFWQICVPEFDSITPADGIAGTAVSITGYYFEENVEAALFDGAKTVYPLENVTVVDESTITADIPATLAPGMYGIQFDGTLGQHTETVDVFEVLVADDDDNDDSADDDTTDDDIADDDATDDDATDDDDEDDDEDDDAADADDDDDNDDDSCCGC